MPQPRWGWRWMATGFPKVGAAPTLGCGPSPRRGVESRGGWRNLPVGSHLSILWTVSIVNGQPHELADSASQEPVQRVDRPIREGRASNDHSLRASRRGRDVPPRVQPIGACLYSVVAIFQAVPAGRDDRDYEVARRTLPSNLPIEKPSARRSIQVHIKTPQRAARVSKRSAGLRAIAARVSPSTRSVLRRPPPPWRGLYLAFRCHTTRAAWRSTQK